MWTWDDTRKQYYFHQYLPEQPDLNWRNPALVKESTVSNVYWADPGFKKGGQIKKLKFK